MSDPVAQDLLFIQELLGPQYDKIAEEEGGSECSTPAQHESALPVEDSDSESSSESDEEPEIERERVHVACEDEEEDSLPAKQNSYFQTKHEVDDDAFAVPDIEQVGPDEVLEPVGEVSGIVESTIIVKGVRIDPKDTNRTLDIPTLLVFEDRTVLGYIYDTFGPTTEPLYQIRFKGPIDPQKIQISRKVYHIPSRSHFVFVSASKGSDASNCYDEEPAEHELEFSDDEAEQAFKRNRRTVSRHSTPMTSDPPQAHYGGNPFDEHSPYDLDYLPPPPPRPAPLPYNDDPYQPSAVDEARALRPVRIPRRRRQTEGYDPSSPGFMPVEATTAVPSQRSHQWSSPTMVPHINPRFVSGFLPYPQAYQPNAFNQHAERPD